MTETIINMYLTIISVIAAGVMNMIFTKTSVYRKYNYPIDGNTVLRDGKRLFGENKTWAGFAGMIVLNAIFQLVSGFVFETAGIADRIDFYNIHKFSASYSLLCGTLCGLVYMICELPNSFIKRRIGISAGKTDKGLKGVLFFIVDQFDSIIGVGILIGILSGISAVKTFGYILLGGLTHITVNLVLYKLKIRKNI